MAPNRKEYSKENILHLVIGKNLKEELILEVNKIKEETGLEITLSQYIRSILEKRCKKNTLKENSTRVTP